MWPPVTRVTTRMRHQPLLLQPSECVEWFQPAQALPPAECRRAGKPASGPLPVPDMFDMFDMFDTYALLSSVISHELSRATCVRAPHVQRFCGYNGTAERVVEWSPNRDERSHAHFQFNLNRRCNCIRFQEKYKYTFFRANFISMCDGMIMTPAILAPMRPIFSRQARTGTHQYRNRIDHKFRYQRPKKKMNVRGLNDKIKSFSNQGSRKWKALYIYVACVWRQHGRYFAATS